MWKLNSIFLRNKSVAWLIMAAVLAMAVIPVHMHFHHADDGATVLHEVDLHVETGGLADHSDHTDTHILKASPNALAKKSDGAVKVLLPAALLFILLTVVRARQSAWQVVSSVQPGCSYHYLIPHLRAPPRH